MKNNFLTTTLLLASIVLFAQDNKNKIFYLDSLHNVTTEKNHKYTRVIEDYNTKKDTYMVSEYYSSGKISMSAITKNKNTLKLEGARIDYYENGNKKQESNYIDNNLNRRQLQWYENGDKKSEKEITWDAQNKNPIIKVVQFWNKEGQQTVIDGNGQYEATDENLYEKGEIKNGEKQGVWEGKNLKEKFSYTELYKNGKFISGISTDENNNKFPYKEIMEKPAPAKGMADFYNFIGRNFKTSKNENINGKIYTKFIINKNGNITDVKTVKGLREDLDTQAIKLIYQYGNWIPGKRRGIPINETYNFPISIKSSAGYQNNSYPTDMIKNTNPNW